MVPTQKELTSLETDRRLAREPWNESIRGLYLQVLDVECELEQDELSCLRNYKWKISSKWFCSLKEVTVSAHQ